MEKNELVFIFNWEYFYIENLFLIQTNCNFFPLSLVF